jgi:hypothetical protein
VQNLRVLSIGTAERITLKIQFEHLIAAIAANCSRLERLEFRWDREEIRKLRPLRDTPRKPQGLQNL